MSAMIMLEVPHINILSKMDLVKDQVRKRDLKRFINPDSTLLDDDPADTARRAVEAQRHCCGQKRRELQIERVWMAVRHSFYPQCRCARASQSRW